MSWNCSCEKQELRQVKSRSDGTYLNIAYSILWPCSQFRHFDSPELINFHGPDWGARTGCGWLAPAHSSTLRPSLASAPPSPYARRGEGRIATAPRGHEQMGCPRRPCDDAHQYIGHHSMLFFILGILAHLSLAHA